VIVSGRDEKAAALDYGMGASREEGSEFVVKRFVDLVEKKHLGVSFFGHRQPESSSHTLGVGGDRPFKRLVEAAPVLDGVHGAQDHTPRKPADHPE
jgi:hypothetical protein